jgi:hypothetical protein
MVSVKYLWQKIDDKTVMAGRLRHPKVTFDLNLKVRCFGLLPTRRGLLVPHRKPLDPFLNGFLLTSLGKSAGRVSVSA